MFFFSVCPCIFAFSIKMTSKKLISASSVMQLKNKKSHISFLKSEIVLSKRITDFLWLIIASFINNVPFPTRVLHRTPRHRCLLYYLFGRFTMRQLRGCNCWGVRYCINSNHILHLAYLVVIIINVRDLKTECDRRCRDRF